jgi:hypothetical protein
VKDEPGAPAVVDRATFQGELDVRRPTEAGCQDRNAGTPQMRIGDPVTEALCVAGSSVHGYRDRGAARIRCELRRTVSERSSPSSSEKHLAVIGPAGHGR